MLGWSQRHQLTVPIVYFVHTHTADTISSPPLCTFILKCWLHYSHHLDSGSSEFRDLLETSCSTATSSERQDQSQDDLYKVNENCLHNISFLEIESIFGSVSSSGTFTLISILFILLSLSLNSVDATSFSEWQIGHCILGQEFLQIYLCNCFESTVLGININISLNVKSKYILNMQLLRNTSKIK